MNYLQGWYQHTLDCMERLKTQNSGKELLTPEFTNHMSNASILKNILKNQNESCVWREEMNEHQKHCLTVLLQSYLDFTTESNGHVDNRQVLIFKVNGEEIGRSEGGKRTMTPLFKQLVINKINEAYG